MLKNGLGTWEREKTPSGELDGKQMDQLKRRRRMAEKRAQTKAERQLQADFGEDGVDSGDDSGNDNGDDEVAPPVLSIKRMIAARRAASHEDWDPQELVAALEQADTAVEALAAISRIAEKLDAKLCDDEGKGNSNCPGIASFTRTDKDGEELYAARVRARALLKKSANAAIIHAILLFNDDEFKKVAFKALHGLNRALISSPNLMDDDDEIESVCFASSFNRPSTDAGSSADATWSDLRVCKTLIGAVRLPPAEQPADGLIEQLLADEIWHLCSVIGLFAELGWRAALIRAGAARFLVSVSQLMSPRSLATEGLGDNASTVFTSLIALSECYNAFSSLFDPPQNWCDPAFVREISVETDLLTATRIDAFVTEARRTLSQYSISSTWGVMVRQAALKALAAAYDVLQILVIVEGNYHSWIQRTGAGEQVPADSPWNGLALRSEGGSFWEFKNSGA
jgi:hypothetical protein